MSRGGYEWRIFNKFLHKSKVSHFYTSFPGQLEWIEMKNFKEIFPSFLVETDDFWKAILKMNFSITKRAPTLKIK